MNAEEAILYVQKWLNNVEGVNLNWLYCQADNTDKKDYEAIKLINKIINKNKEEK
jgi:hypothetical protein